MPYNTFICCMSALFCQVPQSIFNQCFHLVFISDCWLVECSRFSTSENSSQLLHHSHKWHLSFLLFEQCFFLLANKNTSNDKNAFHFPSFFLFKILTFKIHNLHMNLQKCVLKCYLSESLISYAFICHLLKNAMNFCCNTIDK